VRDNNCCPAVFVNELMERYGPKRFIGLVTDNAANMVTMRNLVVKQYPHLLEVR